MPGNARWGVVWGIGVVASLAWLACSDESAVVTVIDSGTPAVDATPSPTSLPPADAAGDAPVSSDASLEASQEAGDAAPPPLHKVSGHVVYGGDVVGATVALLAPYAATATTGANGNFEFVLPEGRTAIFKVTPPAATGALPMIRGVVVKANLRPREFYLVGQDERAAAQALGVTLDATKSIVEVDFRNASTGGYSAVLKSGGGAITPGFGIVLDSGGMPVASTTTVAGGGGSTLILGNIVPATFAITASSPADAGASCKACDAPELPMEANVVTWVDYECGAANCE